MGIFSGHGSFLALKVIFEYILDCLKYFIFGMTYTEENIQGKFVIVTGANSGIGKAAAAEFAKRGATVIMACRDLTEGQNALDDIKNKNEKEHGMGKLVLAHLDLGDLSSVRKFAKIINTQYKKVHILVCNAGLSDITGKLPKTKDGFEPHMGVNHLGHFSLVNLLTDALRNGAPSRVVVVSSTMQMFNSLDLDDLMLDKAGVGKGYSNSKYANSLFAKQLGKKLSGTGITTYSMCPGIVNTSITRHSPRARKRFWQVSMSFVGFTAEKGCQTILYCALSKEIAHESGKFYRFGKTVESVNRILTNEIAKRLWNLSQDLVQDKKQE